MAERLRLYGLKALVTSAAGGIGEAVSRTLVKHGASVIAVDVPGSGVEQHFASVKGIVGLTANLGDATRMPALVEKVLSGVATAPASAAPKKPGKYSSRFVVIVATRTPLPTSQATSDFATAMARSHASL